MKNSVFSSEALDVDVSMKFMEKFEEKFSRHLACFNAQIVTNEESGTRIRVSSSSVVFFL